MSNNSFLLKILNINEEDILQLDTISQPNESVIVKIKLIDGIEDSQVICLLQKEVSTINYNIAFRESLVKT